MGLHDGSESSASRKNWVEEEQVFDPGLIRLILGASQKLLSPRHYDQFLRQAGLERFKQPPPALAKEQFVPYSELASFMRAVAAKLGIQTIKLFYVNVAEEITLQLKRHPYCLQLKAQIMALPPEQRAEKAVQSFVEWTNLLGAELTFLPTYSPHLWRVVMYPCSLCVGIKAEVPVCDISRIHLAELPAFLADLKFEAVEIECKAMGQAECICEIRELSD